MLLCTTSISPSTARCSLVSTRTRSRRPVLPVKSPPMADFLEGYLTMKQHVLVRFGKWHVIVAQELPQDQQLYCSNVAMT